MKFIILNICAVFLLPIFTAGQPCNATVNINTNIKFSQIFIDNNFRGEGNLSIKLLKGNHSILIKESKLGWGSQIIHDQILINDCSKNYSFDYNFDKNIFLNSDPSDAYVYLNDSLIGHTPLFLRSKGIEYLSLSKAGYSPELINLKDYQLGNIAELESVHSETNGSFVKSPWFKVLFGSALALGTAAAYFKIKADSKYDKYIQTHDRQYLDETDKMDLLSGIAFGALQINFGVLIYYFITE